MESADRPGPGAGPDPGAGSPPERADLERRIAERTAELEAVNRELRESRRMLQLVLDTIPARVFWKDRQSRFLGANLVFAHDAGVAAPGDLIGTTDDEWPWREFAEHYREDDRAVMETGVPKIGFVEQQRTPSGGTIWLRTSKIPLQDESGAVVGLLGTYEEITESYEAQERARRAAEELRAANVELERASRLKNEFLATMSHELRTPLSSILGQADALLEGVFGPIEGKHRTAVDTIARSGRHLLELINDLLDLSRIEAGQLKLEMGSVPLSSLVQASLELVRQQAASKRIALSATLDETARVVQGDGRRLRQVLVNLLSNAVKFTPEGGAAGVVVASDGEARTVSLTVWDTGIGIAAENLSRIFLPFVQLDGRLSRRYPGTGLGLPIVQRLTALHGGTVHVESTPGGGSRFRVDLPWSPDRPRPPLAARAAAPEGAPRTVDRAAGGQAPLILIVEDDPSLSQLLVDYLGSRGYRTAAAFDGVDAVEWLGRNRPDAVLMDIQMPRMDGLEATRWIRAQPELARIPVIALTALAMPGDEERCLAAGANTYVSKPAVLGKVAAALAEHLCGAREV